MNKDAYRMIVEQLCVLTQAEFILQCELVRPEDCTDEYLAALLYVNDPNGDFDECTHDELLHLFATELAPVKHAEQSAMSDIPPLNWLLYDAMNAADRIFQALLVQQYGKAAGTMRYQHMHTREDINVAGRQFVALCEAWFKYYEGYRQDWLS